MELVPIEQKLAQIQTAIAPILEAKLTVETEEESAQVQDLLITIKTHEKVLKERELEYLAPYAEAYNETLKIKDIFKGFQSSLKNQTVFLKDGLSQYRLFQMRKAEELARQEQARVRKEREAQEEIARKAQAEIDALQKKIELEAEKDDWEQKARLEKLQKEQQEKEEKARLEALAVVPQAVEVPQAMKTDKGGISESFYNDYDVIDIWKIPREFLKVEIKRRELLAYIKDGQAVEGITIRQAVTLGTRSK